MLELLEKPCQTKICTKCGVEKDVNLFQKDSRYLDGFLSWCKQCKYDSQNKRRQENREHCLERDKKYREKYSRQFMWAKDTISKHRKYGYTVDFSVKELEKYALETPKCEYCLIEMAWGKGNIKRRQNSPTLENIDCKQELSLEDIAIICNQCNTTKGPRNMKQFIEYCKNIAENENRLILISLGGK